MLKLLQYALHDRSVAWDVLPQEAVGLHNALEELGPPLNNLEIGDSSLLDTRLPLLVRLDSPKESERVFSVLLVGSCLRNVLEKLNLPVEELKEPRELLR